ncbi:MAG: methionine synthase, partial [Deltaproteobacteria bacterium]|nr:methionine synthase [Deltaproteobacteria bacterium]
MHALIEKLIKNGPVITDGAWGTELQSRGLQPGKSPESWNLDHPDQVQEVPAAYVQAGSHIVLTNTFGANHFVQKKFKLEGKIPEINRAGVDISRKAVKGSDTLVFASIGPSGRMLLMKEVTTSELQETFEEQATAIAEAGADGIVVETMIDINEALIAIAAAKKTGLPVVGCMTLDSGKNKDRTMMGNTAGEVAEKFTAAGVDVVGSNCGQGIEGFINICQQMRQVTTLPLWMKANAGLPEFVDGQTVFNTSPEEFVKLVPDLLNAGANFIGGCCGTNPSFIK